MAGASSPKPAMAADDVEMADTSGPSAAVELFGSEITSFGVFICNAVERHMLRCHDPEAVSPISWGMVRSDVAARSSGATVVDSDDQIDLIEVTSVGKRLKARLENKDGIVGVVGALSKPDQLQDLWVRCGGQQQLDADIFIWSSMCTSMWTAASSLTDFRSDLATMACLDFHALRVTMVAR